MGSLTKIRCVLHCSGWTWGGTTVATSSSSGVNARWGSSMPLPDFPISGNHFPISVILLISGYREIISRYREIISRYRKMRFISRYRELFPDIGKLNSRYQKIIRYFPISGIRIPDIGKWFPDIGNYFPISVIQFPISGNNSRYREMINKNPNGFPYTGTSMHCETVKGEKKKVGVVGWRVGRSRLISLFGAKRAPKKKKKKKRKRKTNKIEKEKKRYVAGLRKPGQKW